jgi:hypothetical protein
MFSMMLQLAKAAYAVGISAYCDELDHQEVAQIYESRLWSFAEACVDSRIHEMVWLGLWLIFALLYSLVQWLWIFLDFVGIKELKTPQL